MENHDIPNSYGRRDRYCADPYVCLWQVKEEESVAHWDWVELGVRRLVPRDERTCLSCFQAEIHRESREAGSDDIYD